MKAIWASRWHGPIPVRIISRDRTHKLETYECEVTESHPPYEVNERVDIPYMDLYESYSYKSNGMIEYKGKP